MGGMGCCSFGCFSIIFCTLIDRRVCSGVGNRIVAVGAEVSSGDDQLAETSFRVVIAWSWAYDWAVGASAREFISMVIP